MPTKFVSRIAYFAEALCPGALAMAHRARLWDALKAAVGLTDVDRVTITASAALTVTQCGTLQVDATAGNIVLTLPASGVDTDEALYEVDRLDGTANTVTFAAAGADTVEGGASVAVLGTMRLRLPAGKTDWRVHGISGGTPAKARAALGITSVKQIQPLTAVANTPANGLTITLAPTRLDFRSATLNDGTVTSVENAAALTLVVPSGATLGSRAATLENYRVVVLLNAGVMELAIVNIASGKDLSEEGVITTIVLDAASDSAGVIYSAAARAGVPYRVVGGIAGTQAVPGTWVTALTLVQGIGGKALTKAAGRTMQNVTSPRSVNVTQYNTTDDEIDVFFTGTNTVAGGGCIAYVDGVALGQTGGPYANGQNVDVQFVVPPGSSYSIGPAAGSVAKSTWFEYRKP